MVPDLFPNRYLKYLSMYFSAAPAEVSKFIKYKTCSIRENQTETLVGIVARAVASGMKGGNDYGRGLAISTDRLRPA